MICVESALFPKNFLLEQESAAWLGRLQGAIGPDVPWIGFCSFGEIATEQGLPLSMDQATALAVIS